MDDIAAQEAAIKLAIANYKPRALQRELRHTLSRVRHREEEYKKILEQKKHDKTSSMFMSPVKVRPKTTGTTVNRSTVWHDDTEDGDLFICRESPGSTPGTTSLLSVAKVSLHSLRPAIRTSKVFPKPPALHTKPTLPTTTPVLLPCGSPIAKAITPYYQKKKGNKQVQQLTLQHAKTIQKRHKKQSRHDFLFHDPGLSPASQMSTSSVPFLDNPQFYKWKSSKLEQDADGVKLVKHHKEYYCRN